jgi:NAD(P)-dependent dehydrogenase (short-subunit alcohol dehydrogenase family)
VLVNASPSFHIIMAGRSLEKAEAAKSEIEVSGIKGTLSALQLEVTDEASIQKAAAQVQQQFGRLDILINNAASGSMDPDVKTRFKLCLDTNVLGPAMVTAAFRPLLLESPNAYSIFVSSGQRTLLRNAIQEPPPTHDHIRNGDAYAVSKAALNMLAVLEHRDYANKGLKVFALSPGFVVSNLRGSSEEARTGWGQAGDPMGSGQIVLNIVQGKRDADVGCLVHSDGIYPW